MLTLSLGLQEEAKPPLTGNCWVSGEDPSFPITISPRSVCPFIAHIDTRDRSGVHAVHVFFEGSYDSSDSRFVLVFRAEVDCLPGVSCVPNELTLDTSTGEEKVLYVGSAQQKPFEIERIEISDPSLLNVEFHKCGPQTDLAGEVRPHPMWNPQFRVHLKSVSTLDEPTNRVFVRVWTQNYQKPLEVPLQLFNNLIPAAMPDRLWLSQGTGEMNKCVLRVTGYPIDLPLEFTFHGTDGRVVRERHLKTTNFSRLFELEVQTPATTNDLCNIEVVGRGNDVDIPILKVPILYARD